MTELLHKTLAGASKQYMITCWKAFCPNTFRSARCFSSQPTVLFFHTKSAPVTNQPAVIFSHNKQAPATSRSEQNRVINNLSCPPKKDPIKVQVTSDYLFILCLIDLFWMMARVGFLISILNLLLHIFRVAQRPHGFWYLAASSASN